MTAVWLLDVKMSQDLDFLHLTQGRFLRYSQYFGGDVKNPDLHSLCFTSRIYRIRGHIPILSEAFSVGSFNAVSTSLIFLSNPDSVIVSYGWTSIALSFVDLTYPTNPFCRDVKAVFHSSGTSAFSDCS